MRLVDYLIEVRNESFLNAKELQPVAFEGDDSIDDVKDRDYIYNKPDTHLILGHRRLSIIDLSVNGHQPYSHIDLHLIFNGEIYNYLELREDLVIEGYSFDTNSDTEVFLKAYHFWGKESFNKLNGMWAAAIYDKSNDTITLTRDRFGIKPLYYSLTNDNLIFGSEIKFVSSFHSKLFVNEHMVHDYIESGHISHSEDTFIKNIFQLKAGTFSTYEGNILKSEIYYNDSSYTEKSNSPDNVKKILFDSIRLRMRSDVIVGSLLSGGMDSSSIVCSVHEQKLAQDMNTFTISYEEKELDFEAKYVNDINIQTGFKNHSIQLAPDDQTIDELTYIIESPYRSFTESAMFNIYKYIKEKTDITVLLNGEGSDEIFSGYNAHYSFYLLTLLYNFKFFQFINEFQIIKKRKKQSSTGLTIDIIKAFLIHTNLNIWFKNKLRGNSFFAKEYSPQKPSYSKNPLRNALLLNRKYSALPEYLVYADKIPMHFSLEVRVPFLDYRLVSTANALKDASLIKNGVTKFILRESMKGTIPQSVYERKDKKGFFTPHELWLNTKFNQTISKEMQEIGSQGIFSFMNHQNILKHFKKYGSDQKIWRIYCLSRWKKVWNIVE
jgi:asparagine synthase (glutamine-hydrolysing)